ncbi:MAG: thiolase family protein [Ardenticatenaceae bacterium]|nr:thiolase family protein [Ardenticatenaceae bacterium]
MIGPHIVAVAQTPYSLSWRGASLEEMIYQTVAGLLRQAHITLRDVDHVSIAASDGLDGRAISPMLTAASAGSVGKDLINSASASEHALLLACLRLLSGEARMALVASWAKPSESDLAGVDSASLDPFFHRPLGADRTTYLALQASAYCERYGIGRAEAAQVVIKNRSAAARNPLGLRPPPIDERALAAAPMAAWPLSTTELPTLVDGVVVMLVTNEDVARSMTNRYAVVEGFGWASDTYWLGERAPGALDSLRLAAHMAYERAGLKGIHDNVDFIELSDLTPYHEFMAYEALGLCEPGQGSAIVQADGLRAAGVTVNASGGLQAGYLDFASGLERVAEVVRQVTGVAGEHQLEKAYRGVAHAVGGHAAQSNSVFVIAGVRRDG